MYPKTKSSGVPSDAQSKEKLAVYVYEYLIHIGAQKTASSFLQEIRWDKSISVGEPPGFLHSWWNVFWDLYSAAPERRDTHDHSSEAKAFHDYGFVNSGYPNGLPHPGHPIMSGSAGVGGPSSNSGPGMPPPLGPPAPDPVPMRQRPSGPMLPGGGLPPGAGPGIPSPHHPSMRFHQAGGYPGPPSGGGGMIPQHANLIPGGGPLHPMHGGPMLSQHHHHPGAMMSGHRARWLGPGMPQAAPSSGPGQPQQASVVGPGSVGPNSVSSAGPSSVGPGPCGAAGGPGGNASGIVQSPGHPGTPNAHLGPSQHLASPSPLNNQSNCHSTTLPEHQSCGSSLPPGHPHHPAPHYVGQQPQQQQQTPPSSSACIPSEYSTRPSPHMVFGGNSGGPGSTPEGPMFGAGDPGISSGGGSGSVSNLPPRSSGMLPPPPPEYSSGVPPVSSSYTSSSDLKASPLHGNPNLSGADILGGISAMTPSDYPSVSGGNGNGLGSTGSGGFGPTSDSQMMMMMPPPHQQTAGGMIQSQQQHLVSGGNCQAQVPPPPQYAHSGSANSAPSQPSNGGNGSGTASSASPSGGPGSVQFPQEYSFNQIS